MRRLICAAALAVLFLAPAFGDLYSPDRPLERVDTEYFTIIYPEESRAAAGYLAGFADETYREIAALLKTTPRFKIPVVITPDSEELNGYFTWIPYLRIVLYQAPVDMNSTLGSFEDDLYKLFYHELTHAVSMTIRSPFEDALAAVFGTPVALSPYLAPLSFVEGVTVSFESRNGHGRAVDPLAGAYVRQDIVEGRFKTFVQAMGAYDRYPGAGLYYLYGGYFSRYLQERFGVDRYADIWRCFGFKYLFKTLEDGPFGIPGRFRETFGVGLDEAWQDFGRWMTIREPVVMSVEPLAPLSRVDTLAASNRYLYWADASEGAVRRLDTDTGAERTLFRAGASISRLAPSPDGSRLLVSTHRSEAGFPRLVVKEWDEGSRRLRDMPWSGLREAAYTPVEGSVVGIAIDGYMTHLALASQDGVRVLLRGTERLSFASPSVSADGKELYALAKEDGLVSIVRVRFIEALGDIASVERLALPEDLSWIRYLSLSLDGVLRFSWDDQAFYRLAELDGEELRYQSIPLSGGVHQPVQAGDRVYYLGRFSSGIAPCAFPLDRGPLGFLETVVSWEPADDLRSKASAYETSAPLAGRPYSPLPWLLPRFWFPAAHMDSSGFYAFGATAVLADPVERLSVAVEALWNTRANGVNAALELAYKGLDPTLSLKARDGFARDGERDAWYRSSAAALGIQHGIPTFSGAYLGWGASAAIEASAWLPETGSSYVSWTDAAAGADAQLSWTDLRSPLSDPLARTGYMVALRATGGMEVLPTAGAGFAGLEAALRGFVGTAAMNVSAYGAGAALGELAYGPTGRRVGEGAPTAALYPLWKEFEGEGSGPWYAQGEASLRLLSMELQETRGPLYLNRLAFRSGARAFALGDASLGLSSFGWSAFCRAELTVTLPLGAFANAHPTLSAEYWMRPDRASETSIPHGLTLSLSADL